MKTRAILILSSVLTLTASCAGERVDVREAAVAVTERGKDYIDPRHYAGTVYTQALAELYLATGDEFFLSEVTGILDKFASGESVGYGSFISYEIGGSAAPELAWRGFDKYREMSLYTARKMCLSQPRNADSLMLPPWKEAIEKSGVFVDPLFAVTPFMLYSGLIDGNAEWVDYAAWSTLKTFSDLRDSSTGLIHQARGVRWMPSDKITEDCWSRGNGWGAMALGILLRDLPKDNPRYAEVADLARDYFAAALRCQDSDGLWHQEMTWPDSYVEVSGSALLLYGIGCGIGAGVLPSSCKDSFERGIRGLLRYVDASGNVGNVCSGCLAWGDGSKKAYADHPCFCNEKHAFGPVLLALGEALELGVRTVRTTPGSALAGRTPACAVRFVQDRKDDIAWENDRAAFRIYSQQVKAKVSSGVDYWAKRVEYPVIDKWYAKDAAGGSYHVDEGEGCDFYAVGKNRGIGGIGIWTGGGMLVPEPYVSHSINCDTPGYVSFTVTYPDIVTPDDTVSLRETVSMRLCDYLYKADVYAKTASGRPVTLCAGLTGFGKAEIVRSQERSSLLLMEYIDEVQETVGSLIVADGLRFKGFASSGKDELVLMDLPSGGCTSFYAGAAWSRDTRFDPFAKRWRQMAAETDYEKLLPSDGTAQVAARFVPERYDDFIFENDLIAGRFYGEALESCGPGQITSPGVDVWVKTPGALVADRRYVDELRHGRTYHKDWGDGKDCYKVGRSLGAGASSPVVDGKVCLPATNFRDWRILEKTDSKVVFELEYPSWTLPDGIEVALTKRLTVTAGTYFVKCEDTYTFSGASTLCIAAGINRHLPQDITVAESFGRRSYALWEHASDQSVEPEDGFIGVAVVMQGAEAVSPIGDGQSAGCLRTVKSGETLTYYFGSCWSKGLVKTPEDWFDIVSRIK